VRTLILGGARSGKSKFAEEVAAGTSVRYVATAVPDPADTDFAERIAVHRARRPTHWTTVDSADVVATLRNPVPETTLIDDIGTWLTARLDAHSAWDAPRGIVAPDCSALASAVADYRQRLVIVSPEVGMGVVPATRSGRLFRDEIGALNQQLAATCDEAFLVVAGIAMRLK